ncbi:uncharacterized protein BJ171DRAFT_518463 [Polychytrium aggregatum]|uniref:uncharacterized protein n=1 Tax=Polychytrium aggregatum TaxID=110093 RepID=UPI0022FEC3B8|nr:uncharacterized protein BJ171DRAFT_518463 [Polychytrium aggregatum]KAI9199455.1 hypothetical protein BJ171DRAFT_518463 [Polychytrium aggregatum]
MGYGGGVLMSLLGGWRCLRMPCASMARRANACKTQPDYLMLFAIVGISGPDAAATLFTARKLRSPSRLTAVVLCI